MATEPGEGGVSGAAPKPNLERQEIQRTSALSQSGVARPRGQTLQRKDKGSVRSAVPKTQCPNFNWVRRRPGDLAERTMLALRRTFEERDHHPSEAQLASLEESACLIQAMADGSPGLDRHFYLSSLAPGIGKTSLDIEAIRQLVQMPEYQNVGVMFLIARCEEIKGIAEEMGLYELDYAVYVTEGTEPCKEIYKDGNPDRIDARVLFTTQAMLGARLRHGGSFAALKDFWFRGQPRRVRIWDEAILPSRIITVGLHQIKHLFKDLGRAGFTDVLAALDRFEDTLKFAKDQGIVQVPDLEALSLGLEDFLSAFESNEDRDVVADLWKLSDCPVRVRRDRVTNVLVDYEDLFPKDLGPMLVQDASGGLRKVYDLWRKDRGGLCGLQSAPKNYGGLTFHHWDRGAGRDIFRPGNKKGDEIISGVVSAIEDIPASEPVLVVHYKQKKYVRDIAGEIQIRLGARKNVHFIHWGIHTATNNFQHFKYVFLIGAFQYNVPVNEAYGRSAKGIPAREPLTAEELNQVRLGEIEHNIYQAACRGNVRKSEGDGCRAGNHVFAIFSTHKSAGMPRELLGSVFPGANIVDWEPMAAGLSPRETELVRMLSAEGQGGTYRKAELRLALSVTHPTLGSSSKMYRDP